MQERQKLARQAIWFKLSWECMESPDLRRHGVVVK